MEYRQVMLTLERHRQINRERITVEHTRALLHSLSVLVTVSQVGSLCFFK